MLSNFILQHCLFERQYNREEISHLLVCSPHASNSKGWARLKIGTRIHLGLLQGWQGSKHLGLFHLPPTFSSKLHWKQNGWDLGIWNVPALPGHPQLCNHSALLLYLLSLKPSPIVLVWCIRAMDRVSAVFPWALYFTQVNCILFPGILTTWYRPDLGEFINQPPQGSQKGSVF